LPISGGRWIGSLESVCIELLRTADGRRIERIDLRPDWNATAGTTMNYQLVIQFEDEGGEALERIEELEGELIELIGVLGEVDGHEVGSGTASIVIHTEKPKRVWEKIEPVVERAAEDDLVAIAAAYRPFDAEDFTVLWPVDFEGEFELS